MNCLDFTNHFPAGHRVAHVYLRDRDFFYVISSLLYSMWLEENSVNKYDVIFLIKGAQNKCPQLISSPDIIA